MLEPGPGLALEVAPLIEAASRGDEGAWRSLVDLYARRVFALARSRCGDPDLAEEITQGVFATVAEKIGSSAGGSGYRERGKFEAWLFRIAMNRVRDEARRRTRRRRLEGGLRLTVDREAGDTAGLDGTDESHAALRRALAKLNEADRDVIELRHHSGLSFQQIADLRGEPVGTLLARHHRALRKLRGLIEADAHGPGASLGREAV